MATAFVLINAEIGGEEEALRAIEKVEGVEEAYWDSIYLFSKYGVTYVSM